ncbi:AAA family ATPase [Streptomyces albipurpureus]|uniref:AAA family ATPase n=1 Tax=Streptomyces albipurpureus TaxID=2897419 RepID=A0ABT0USK5_9ACTN|nr:AAA family ATPase [Streptomyces sp. CWNU-1]MCM2390610.1 AAA family ATPase [Streptomyces sp. CWNU-1]
MIVWVNGAFGSGKTTLVGEVHQHWPEALVYDPEQVGYVLGDIVDVPSGDFQDLPIWRRQVVSMAVGLVAEYQRPILAPMTLVNPQYLGEIFGALEEAGVDIHHFFLKVSPEVLAQRIDARSVTPHDPARDEGVRQWCREQIDRCVAAVDTLPRDTIFLDGERPREELAREVLTRIGVRSPRPARA